MNNVKSKVSRYVLRLLFEQFLFQLPSSAALHEEEDHSSLLSRVKDNVLKPIETTATNLRDKVSTISRS